MQRRTCIELRLMERIGCSYTKISYSHFFIVGKFRSTVGTVLLFVLYLCRMIQCNSALYTQKHSPSG